MFYEIKYPPTKEIIGVKFNDEGQACSLMVSKYYKSKGALSMMYLRDALPSRNLASYDSIFAWLDSPESDEAISEAILLDRTYEPAVD